VLVNGKHGAHTFRDGANRAAFTSGITTFEDDDHSKAFVFGPSLKLVADSFVLVLLTLQLPALGFICCH